MPTITYANVDRADLVATFARAATEAGARVHLVAGSTVPDDVLVTILRDHTVATAVATEEPDASRVLARLPGVAPFGAPVSAVFGEDADRTLREAADLGVTSAIAAVAATGSLVLDATVAGDRTTSLLPRVHLAVIHAAQIVATPTDVWRRYDDTPTDLPSNLVLVTGPSRTGDIEQLLTIGVHGPQAVEIIVLT